MKLGCVIATPDVAHGPLALLIGTLEQKLERARHLGYDGVEFMIRDPASLDVDQIKEALARNNLEMPQVVTGELFGADGLALVHPDPAVCERAMDRAQGIVRLAGAVGRGTMVNIGRLRGRLDWLAVDASTARARAVSTLRALADYARLHHVRITLEPINRYEVDFVHTAHEALQIVAEVDRPNFGLMLDLFHMNIEDRSIEGAFREARHVLWHVHVADSNRLAPGQGHLDFKEIVRALRDLDYTEYLSAELRPLPDPDTAARLTIEHMRRLM